jgi:hypothetical protein
MVGHDDETWDIAVTIPIATVETIVADARAGAWQPADSQGCAPT